METKPKNWPLYRAAAYLGGKGITYGATVLSPQATNQDVFSLSIDSIKSGDRVAAQTEDLGFLADNSLDHVWVGARLGTVEDPQKLLRQASAKLKTNKHLVVHVKLRQTEPGCNPLCPLTVRRMLGEVGKWRVKGAWESNDELLVVAKKLEGRRGLVEASVKPSAKRACVVRYGAIGDAIIVTPLLRKLAEDGYEVTLNTTPYCAKVFESNPYVSNILLQEKDIIPNHELKWYWETWQPEYERYINLSETLEGSLLKVEGRLEFFTPKTWRISEGDKNYYDNTMKVGGYPEVSGTRGELYFTNAEERRAKEFYKKFDSNFLVLWALNGSSHHKVYPLMESVLVEFFSQHPEARAITMGDHVASLLEFEHPQLLPMADKMTLREALIAPKYADLVVGPETMLTNVSGCFDTPKIVLLSHSSRKALCGNFLNDYSLEPDQTIAPCYPCFQLHYSSVGSCPQGTIEDTITGKELATGPVCAMGAIQADRLLARMNEVFELWAQKS